MEELDESKLNTILKECEDYFDFRCTQKPKINFVYTREEMDRALGRKTEAYVIANASSTTLTFMHPDSVAEHSSHVNLNFWGVVKHELIHWVVDEITGKSDGKPMWFNEGLATVLAEQTTSLPTPIKKPVIEHYYANVDENVYRWGYWMVKYLLDKYGQETLVKFVKSLSDDKMSPGFFAKQFMQAYGFNISELQDKTTARFKEGKK